MLSIRLEDAYYRHPKRSKAGTIYFERGKQSCEVSPFFQKRIRQGEHEQRH